MLLKLRIVRPNADPVRWYQILARYGLLFLFAWAPFEIAFGVGMLDVFAEGRFGWSAPLPSMEGASTTWVWLAFMALWIATLVVRAVRAKLRGAPFVMLNGVLSNTRVMTEAGVALMRKQRTVLDVDEVRALEGLIAQDGTPLSELMERAGRAVAEEVRAWVPDPAPVVVLAGAGNNGGDGWVCARALAGRSYPVTLVAPDIAERMKVEPARSTALAVFADAARNALPLRVLVAPDATSSRGALEGARAVVDAVLGTGFSGEEVREPSASWIRAANRRRFEGARRAGRGRHRKRACERGDHERRGDRSLLPKAHGAPSPWAVDVPSGLSAQSGRAARPCFFADLTVTMLAFKPGLSSPAARACGTIRLASLVDIGPHLKRLRGEQTARREAPNERERGTGAKGSASGMGGPGGASAVRTEEKGKRAHAHGPSEVSREGERGVHTRDETTGTRIGCQGADRRRKDYSTRPTAPAQPDPIDGGRPVNPPLPSR